jgi:hypothetical protein
MRHLKFVYYVMGSLVDSVRQVYREVTAFLQKKDVFLFPNYKPQLFYISRAC